MNHADFQKVFEDMVAHCEEVLGAKNKEYASDEDKLHNFKIAADLEGVTVPQACGGMMVKHIVSIYDMIGSNKTFTMDQWNEKIGDALNYLFLLKAILVAESSGELNWRDYLEEGQASQSGELIHKQTLIDRYKDCLCPRCGLGATYFYRCCEEHVAHIFNSICWHCVMQLHPSFIKSHTTLVLSVIDGEVITYEDNQKG